MTNGLTNRLSAEQLQDLLSSALPTEKEHIESHAVQLAGQLLATMQENERLLAEVEMLKQWRTVALAIGENAKRELERQRRDEDDDQNEVSDAG